jgi:hypothetical protein
MKGCIYAPLRAAEEIRAFGWTILSIEPGDCCFEFEVEGPHEALAAMDYKWGEWIWTLDTPYYGESEECLEG